MIAGRSTTGGGTISPFHSHIKDVGYDGIFVAAPPRRTINGAGPRSGRHGRVGPKKGLPGPSLSSRTLGAPPAQIPALPPKTSLQGVLGSSRFVSVLKRKHTSLFYENTDIIYLFQPSPKRQSAWLLLYSTVFILVDRWEIQRSSFCVQILCLSYRDQSLRPSLRILCSGGEKEKQKSSMIHHTLFALAVHGANAISPRL